MATQRDLALAYSPGVAYACEEIADDPTTAALYTGRANLVAVISNGTAVLGLGNIGALASKPVMEGKAALFKKFSGIDVIDLEVDETAVDAFVEAIARLEPTFGGINLEDISAPACFEIEKRLKARMKIPVFHDDQHGTAIVTAAGILNALEITGRKIEEAKIACNGAGAAAIACLDLLVSFGASQGQHPRLRPQGRDPRRPHRPRPVQGRLRREDRQAHARRGDGRRRHLPRPLGQGLGDAGDG